MSRRSYRAGNRTLARFTAALSVASVAAGIVAFIVAHAIANGFRGEVRDKLVANTPHITVFRLDRGDIQQAEDLVERIQTVKNVDSAKAMRSEQILVAGADRIESGMLYVSAKGDGNTIDIGKELAESIGAKEGSMVEAISLMGDAAGKRVRVKVGSLVETGIYEQDAERIEASPRVYSTITGRVFAPNFISIAVSDVFASRKTADEIADEIGPEHRVVDWQEANRPLFAALALERKGGMAVVFLLIAVSMIGIVSTLTMLVNDRRHDIAVLRACGAKTSDILSIFIFEGTFLGAVGIVCGLVVGLFACVAANAFHLFSIDPQVYIVNYIPLRPDLLTVAAGCGITLLLCLAAAFYPALLATRFRPLEDLRR
jgi:lipoprotein-releasing system permease protein